MLLVDDHPVIRQGFRRILTQAFSDLCVGEAETGEQAIALSESSVWDLIILDLSLPGFSRPRSDPRRQADAAGVPHHRGQHSLAAAVRAPRAVGWRRRLSGEERRTRGDGQSGRGSPRGPILRVPLSGGGQRNGSINSPHELLSDREYQVLRMLGGGKTVSEIAAELSLSVKTVSTYRTRILDKTGLRTTAELMHYVIRHNLIP